jgi:hypothetical protein
MDYTLERTLALEREMRDNRGWPVLGVEYEVGQIPRLVMAPGATEAQRAQAQAMLDDPNNWRLRRRRSYADLMGEITALSAADRNKLLNAVCADFLREHPDFARRFNIAVDGDEPSEG